MNLRSRHAALGLVLVGLASMATRAADPVPDDLERLRGSWQMVLLERNGTLVATGTTSITVDGQSVTTIMNGTSVETGHLALDPSTSPRNYDFTITADSDEAGRTFPGIYRLEGDTLETCVPIKHDGTRPKGFVTEPGSGTQRIVWRRIGSMLDAPR